MQKHGIILGMCTILLLLTMLAGAATKVSTFYINETDFVRISASTFDLDNDKVRLYYTLPLDHEGEWQTGYDDAGEYNITITADDGKARSQHKVRLIVKNKNQLPQQMETKIVATEGETVNLKTLIRDPDGDALQFSFGAPFDAGGEWRTAYGDRGTYFTTFNASDGEFAVEGRAQIVVTPGNKAPQIISSFSEGGVVRMKEGQKLDFWAEVEDDDALKYEWELEGKTISTSEAGSVHFDFDKAGSYTLKLTVDDGSEKATKEWTLDVENTNRKPSLTILPQTVREGETIILDLPQQDLDGDALHYSFEHPFDAQGRWQTGFTDAGEHRLSITVTDGEFTEEETVKITVINMDRAPLLNVQPVMEGKEAAKMVIPVIVEDPDGDKVKTTVEGLPDDARFEGKEIIWTPGYETVARRESTFRNLLNALRLEQFLTKQKATVPLSITACGKGLCSQENISLRISNVNRAPVIEPLTDIFVQETERVEIRAQGDDSDKDVVRYYFTKPAGRRSGIWETGYGDEGTHTIYVSATDGRASDTKAVAVHVARANREPVLEVREKEVIVNEGQEFLVRVNAFDPDNDNMTLRADGLPAGAVFQDGIFLWTPPYGVVVNASSREWRSDYLNRKLNKNQAVVIVTFTASDGELETTHPLTIRIKNVNQKPKIVSSSTPENAVAGKPLLFWAKAVDDDGDALYYTWDFGFGQETIEGTDTVEMTFLTPGEKNVMLKVSDGRDEAVQEWKVMIAGQDIREEPPIVNTFDVEQPTFKVFVIEY